MPNSATPGELLTGSYLRLVVGCDLVTYNQHAAARGSQNEIDVVALDSADGTQTVYSCEVVTHLNGIGYGNYGESFDRLRRKFEHHRAEMTSLFRSADAYAFQLWSPVVQPGLVDRLPELADVFADSEAMSLELVLNERYAERIDELRAEAAATTAQRGEFVFRLLQILEHLERE